MRNVEIEDNVSLEVSDDVFEKLVATGAVLRDGNAEWYLNKTHLFTYYEVISLMGS